MRSKGKVSRYNGLQLLRVIAALSVILSHLSGTIVAALGAAHHIWWSGGKAGVDIFFVVSGFVMLYTSADLAETPHGWKTFAQRRITRVVPLYWIASSVLLFVMLLLPKLFRRPDASVGYILSSFFFVPASTSDGQVVPLLSVGWTLNFEMFFYAVFCLALWLRRSALVWVSLVMVFCAALSLLPVQHGAARMFYFNPIVLDFVAGMLIAKALALGWRLPGWVAACSALVSCCILGVTISTGAWEEFFKSGLPAILLVFATASLEHVFERLPALFLLLADASYAMYLFHVFVLDGVRSRLHSVAWLPVSLVYLSVTLVVIAISVALRRYVESPLLRRLNRWLSTGATDVVRQGDAVTARR